MTKKAQIRVYTKTDNRLKKNMSKFGSRKNFSFAGTLEQT